MHVRPPSLCELEISLQGVKLIMSLEDEYDTLDEVWAGTQVHLPKHIQSFASFLFTLLPLVRQMQSLLPDEEHLVLRMPPEEQLVKPTDFVISH